MKTTDVKEIQVKDLEPNLILKPIDRNVPRTRGTNTGELFGGFQLPENIIITKVFPSFHKNAKLVKYINCDYKSEITETSAELPLDFKLTKVGPFKERVLKAVYRRHIETMLHKKLGHAFQVGCDPEIFAVNKDGGIIPAFSFLQSKDKSPQIYWDGFQAEFTTTPTNCLQEQISIIRSTLTRLNQVLTVHDKNASLSLNSVMQVGLDTLKESKPEHVALGCAPSFNVYGTPSIVVSEPENLPIRFAGGHLHFGINNGNYPNGHKQESIERMVRSLDAILGVACVSLFAKFDNPVRREYYGRAGEYRLPKHGLEYRTLSNAWLAHPFIANIVYELGRRCVMLGMNEFNYLWKASDSEVVECINTCNVEMAREILKRNKKILFKMFKASYQWASDSQLQLIYNIFYKGMETVIENPRDLPKNWAMGDDSKYFRDASYVVPNILEKGKKL